MEHLSRSVHVGFEICIVNKSMLLKLIGGNALCYNVASETLFLTAVVNGLQFQLVILR